MRLPACLALGVLVVAACATGNDEPENDDPALEGTTPLGLDEDKDGVVTPADCDDKDPAVKPGATEVCNGKDDNCDGRIDEGFDADNDGFATCQTSTKSADCDDTNAAVNPGAPEVCNNVDDNCDGVVDEGFDKDGDGYYACVRGQTLADCDDDSKTSYPGATEVCDGKDNDCDGKVDDVPATLAGSLAPPTGDTHWRRIGDTTLISTSLGPMAYLTPATGGIAGGLWWAPNDLSSPGYLFDDFEVTATIWIQQPGADGIGFAWYPGTTPRLGYPGEGYGINTIGGYGVVIDTYQNGTDPAPPTLVVYKSAPVGSAVAGQKLYQAQIAEVRDGGSGHAFRVKLTAGLLSVRIDTTDVLVNYAIPGYVPFEGIWGFAAANGGIGNAHAVGNIVMKFPGQGCIQ